MKSYNDYDQRAMANFVGQEPTDTQVLLGKGVHYDLGFSVQGIQFVGQSYSVYVFVRTLYYIYVVLFVLGLAS